MYRVASPGTVTVSIRATNSGSPTGEDLTSGTLNGNTLTENSAGEEVEVAVTSYLLAAETQYAIIVRAPDGDPSNILQWLANVADSYAYGKALYSNDSGSSWSDVVD